MPILEIQIAQTPKDLKAFTKALSTTFAEYIGKPEKLCLVTVTKVDSLFYDGTDEPAYLAKVGSIGHIDNDRNAKLTAAVTAVLEKELGIELNHRGYFIFTDIPGDNIGYKHTTFTNLTK